MRRTTDPRDKRILVNTTQSLKEQLEAIAQERDVSLSLLCYEALSEWLNALDGLNEIVAKVRGDES